MNTHNSPMSFMPSTDSLQAEKFLRSAPVFRSFLEASSNRSECNLESVMLPDYSGTYFKEVLL